MITENSQNAGHTGDDGEQPEDENETDREGRPEKKIVHEAKTSEV